MMVVPMHPHGQKAPTEYTTVEGVRVDLSIGGELRAFYRHINYGGVRVLSDFRSGKRLPGIDLDEFQSAQSALDWLVAEHPPGRVLKTIKAARQLNIL